MPRISPFRALRFADGHFVAAGRALYLVETRPIDAFDPRPPVRFLIGAMEADAAALEPVRPASIQPAADAVPVLAADEEGALADALAEAAQAHPPSWESPADGDRVRTWRLGAGRLHRRIRAAVERARCRPLGEVPERGPFLAAVVPLSDPGLQFLPYHRAVRGLANFSAETFLTLVSDYTRIDELDAPLDDPAGLLAARERLADLAGRRHAFLLVLPGGQGKLLRFRQALELSQIAAAPKSPTLRSLDLALLNALVLRTVLGLREPEAPDHPNVVAVDSLAELVRRVDRGELQAGFALNPPPVWEIRAVIAASQVLPPRTVRLSPGPPAGLLFLSPEKGA